MEHTPTQRPEDWQPRQRWALGACCSAHAIQDGMTAAIYVLLPILAQIFGLSYAHVGLLRSVHSGSMSLLEIPSGLLAERVGERRLLVFGLVCGGAGYLGLSGSQGFNTVLVGLFLAGVGAGFQHALSSSVITTTFTGSARRIALGIYNSSGDFGKLAATGSVSLLLGIGIGWQGVTAGFGLVALLAAVVLLMLLRRINAGSRPQKTHLDSQSASGNPILRDRRSFTALIAIVFFDTAIQDGFLVFVAFLMLHKGVATSLAAFAIVLTLAGGTVGKFGCGLLVARLGAIPSLILVEVLTAIGIVATVLAPPLVAFCLLPLLGMVLQGSSTITYGAFGDLVLPHRYTRGFALIYSTSAIAAAVAPITFGFIADRADVGVAMLAMAAVVLIPIPLSALLRAGLQKTSE